MKKLKIVLVTTLFSIVSTNAFAIPNSWNSGFAQGYSEYSISDTKGQTLWISCNLAGSEDRDHSLKLESKNREITGLSFLINGQTYSPLHMDTFTRAGANDWYEFTHAISKAKKFDIYKGNKKLASFSPTAGSIKSHAKEIANCDPKF